MGLPSYLFSFGIPLLVGVVTLGVYLWNQERLQTYNRGKSRTNFDPRNDAPRTTNSTWQQSTCSICLEDIDPDGAADLDCNHKLHANCFLELCKRGNKRCPECRQPF